MLTVLYASRERVQVKNERETRIRLSSYSTSILPRASLVWLSSFTKTRAVHLIQWQGQLFYLFRIGGSFHFSETERTKNYGRGMVEDVATETSGTGKIPRNTTPAIARARTTVVVGERAIRVSSSWSEEGSRMYMASQFPKSL